MKSYKSLSNYLENKLIENDNIEKFSDINESIGDWIKKINPFGSKTPTKEQEEKTGTLFGFLGAFWSGFKNGGKTAEDPLMKKYAEISKKEAEDEKKRLEKEYSEEQNLEIQKLESEYQHNRAQLDLASKRRIDAFKASQNRLKEMTARMTADEKNGKLLLYSKEQNAEVINMIKNTGKDLGLVEGNPLTRMADLAVLLGTDKDGNPRSAEEILKAAKDDPEVKAQLDEYNSIAEKHGTQIKEGMSSEAFRSSVGKLQNEVVDQAQLNTQLQTAKDNQADYTQKCKAVASVKAMQSAYNKAKEEYDKANVELEKIIGSGENADGASPFAKRYNSETGKVEELKAASFKTALNEYINNAKSECNDSDGHFDVNKLKTKLEELGIPENVITNITNAGDFKDIQDAIKENIENMSNNDAEDASKKVKEKTESNIAAAKSKVKSKQSALDGTVDLSDDRLSKEEKIKKLKDLGNLELAEEYEKIYSAMPKDEVEAHDPSTEAGKTRKTDIEKSVKAAQEAVDQNKANKEANKKAAAEAHDREIERKKTAIPDELKDDVESDESGIEPGESYKVNKDGKKELGFTDSKGNWHKKPGPKETEKNKEYIAARDKHLMELDLTKLNKDKDSHIASIEKDPDDPELYIIKYDDGSEPQKVNKEQAIAKKVNQRTIAKTKAESQERRHKLATNLKACIGTDGKINRDKFRELLDSTDENQQAELNVIKEIINGDESVAEKYFKGIDLDGDTTLNDIVTTLKDNKEKLQADIDNWDDDEYIKGDKNDWDEVEDEDEDASDENEYDSDEEDEDNAKDSDGNKLVKASDGKWYKESDVDADGNPTENAKEQENVYKKKIKNPAKEWKRRKKKNGKGMTKSYYNSEGNKISQDEYKEKMNAYQKAKQKNSSQDESVKYTSLKNYLFEHLY